MCECVGRSPDCWWRHWLRVARHAHCVACVCAYQWPAELLRRIPRAARERPPRGLQSRAHPSPLLHYALGVLRARRPDCVEGAVWLIAGVHFASPRLHTPGARACCAVGMRLTAAGMMWRARVASDEAVSPYVHHRCRLAARHAAAPPARRPHQWQ